MEEHELAVGDSLVIPGVGMLTVHDIEGEAVLIELDLLDEAEEDRLAEEDSAGE